MSILKRILNFKKDDRGAALPIVVLLSAALIASASFAVDLGLQRSARRDMQALADMVAMDASRLVDGRSAAQINAGGGGLMSMPTAVNESSMRNSSTLGSTPDVEYLLVRVDEDNKVIENADGTPQEVTGGNVPNAVMVVAGTEVDFKFAANVDRGGASRVAVAQAEPEGCLAVSSSLLDFSTTNGLVGALLGPLLPGISLSLLGPSGVLDLGVELGPILVAANVGSPEGLVDLGITLFDFFELAVEALQAEGDTASVALLTPFITLPVAQIPPIFSEPVGLDDLAYFTAADGENGFNTVVTLGNLLLAVAGLGTGESGIGVDVGVDLGVASANVGVGIANKPRVGCPDAQNASIEIEADVALFGGLINASVRVATSDVLARLQSLHCTDGQPSSAEVFLEKKDLLSYEVGLGFFDANLVSLVNAPYGQGTVTLPLPEAAEAPYPLGPGEISIVPQFDSDIPGLQQLLDLINILLVPVTFIVGGVGGLVTWILSELLGIDLAMPKVQVIGNPDLKCPTPKLIG